MTFNENILQKETEQSIITKVSKKIYEMASKLFGIIIKIDDISEVVKLGEFDNLIEKIFSNTPLDEQDKDYINTLDRDDLQILNSRLMKYLKKEIIPVWILPNEKVYKEWINLLTLEDLLKLKVIINRQIKNWEEGKITISEESEHKDIENEQNQRANSKIQKMQDFKDKLLLLINDKQKNFKTIIDNYWSLDWLVEKIFTTTQKNQEYDKCIESLNRENLERFQKELTDYLIDIVILGEKYISEQAYEYIKSLRQKYINQIKDIVKSRLSELELEKKEWKREYPRLKTEIEGKPLEEKIEKLNKLPHSFSFYKKAMKSYFYLQWILKKIEENNPHSDSQIQNAA